VNRIAQPAAALVAMKGHHMHATTQLSARAEQRLRQEALIWLVTVREDLTPQASPVWFLWDGETVLIYSQPGTPKLRNIARSATVGLHLNGNATGKDIVIVTGEARIDEGAPPAHEVPDMVRTYVDELRLESSPEAFARTFDGYSVAIRVTPTGFRGV
jgi:PPOX class probable F420-dependent enzyme